MPTKIDYQRIVEEIQNAITSDVNVPQITLSELAGDYLVACEEANQRLRECAELLRKGLRGEAIQRAEIEPNLLDLVALLDFPERAAWFDWLRQSGRATPPALSMDAAAELNAAYAQEAPISSLMKHHRLLALARAPLHDRINVLRHIAEADSGNPMWGDDLRTYERQRQKEVLAEIDAAARTGDASCLTALEQELREAPWIEAPPAALLERVAAQATRLRAQQARAELVQLEPALNAAFSDFDVERGRQLRSRWKACAMLASLAADDPLNEMAAPALNWLGEQDRREQAEAQRAEALAALERGLDDECSRHDLDRLYHRLLSCEHGVPAALEWRFRERTAALALAESRRNKLLIGSVAAAVAIAAGAIWFWIGRQVREAEVAEAVKSLHALLDEAKVAEAQEYLDLLGREKSWIEERPEMEELHARLDGMVKAEADRRAAFSSVLSGAQSAGVDRSDQALLAEAARLAKSSGEKAEVLELERAIAARRRELQDEKNEAFNAQVEQLRLQMERLDQDYPDDLQQRLDAATRLEREVANLLAGGAEAASVNNARALHTRLLALIDTVGHRIDERRRLQEISAAVGNSAQFRGRLTEYIKDFPGAKRSADFQRVLGADVSFEQRLEKWDHLTEEFSTLDIHRMTPAAASARIAEGTALLNEWRNDPQAQQVGARLAVLEPIARRIADGARIDAPLKELFRLPTMSGLKVVETTDARYYTDKEPKTSGNVVTIDYIKDFTLSKRTKTLQRDELPDKLATEAPQAAIGREILKELQHLDDAHWENAFCHMAGVIADDAKLDPILKAQLLLQVLSVGRTGSLVLQHAFAKHFELLSDEAPDGTVNWLDPLDKRAAKAREAAKDLLAGLPDVHAAREAAAKEYAVLRKPWAATKYRWIGWLEQADDGGWKCASSALDETWSGELVLLSESGQPPVIEFAKIGHMEKGQAVLVGAGAMLLEGQPIYAALVDDASTAK